MRTGLLFALYMVGGLARPVQAQALRASPEDLARRQVVMIVLPCDSGAGIVIGEDVNQIFIVTAKHVVHPTKCSGEINVKFAPEDAKRASARIVDEAPAPDDIAVISIPKTSETAAFASGLEYAIVSPKIPVPADQMHSIGKSRGHDWTAWKGESFARADAQLLDTQSDADYGQSGGGLFDASWELTGMVIAAAQGHILAVPVSHLHEVIARMAGVRFDLTLRPSTLHAAGDLERALAVTANLFAERAKESIARDDILGAITFLAEAREAAITPITRAVSLLIGEPPLVLAYSLYPGKHGEYTAIAIDRAKSQLWVGDADGDIEIYDVAAKTTVHGTTKIASGPITSLAVSAVANLAAAGIQTGNGQMTGIAIGDAGLQKAFSVMNVSNTYGPTVTSVYFVGTTRLVALAGTGLVLFDLTTRQELWKKRGKGSWQSLEELSEGKYLATTNSGESTLVELKNDSFVYGSTVVGCPSSGFLLGQLVYQRTAYISADLVSRGCDATLLVSKADGASEKHSARGHSQTISFNEAMPISKGFVTGSWDGTVRVWNADGEMVAQSGVHHGGIRRITIDKSEHFIVTLESDFARFNRGLGGSIRVWRLDPEARSDSLPIQLPIRYPAVPTAAVPPPHYAAPPPPGTSMVVPLSFFPSNACWKQGQIQYVSITNGAPALVATNTITITVGTSLPSPPPRTFVSRDCNFVVAEDTAGLSAFVYDARSQTWILRGTVSASHVFQVGVANSGEAFVWSESDGSGTRFRVKSWDTQTTTITTHVDVADQAIQGTVAISDSGARVAAYVLSTGAMTVWDRKSAKVLLSMTHPVGVPSKLEVFDSDDLTLLFSTNYSLLTAGIKGRKTEILLDGASSTQMFALTPDGEFCIVVGKTWENPDVPRIWVASIRDNDTLAASILPRIPEYMTVAPSSDRIALWFGGNLRYFGMDASLNTRLAATAITGQHWSVSKLVPADDTTP